MSDTTNGLNRISTRETLASVTAERDALRARVAELEAAAQQAPKTEPRREVCVDCRRRTNQLRGCAVYICDPCWAKRCR